MKSPNQFSSSMEQNKIFEEAFNELNDKQREAVKKYEGPVFVLAGPGTGKTQILALRIGYILLHSDTKAHNILCLTYSDAGSIAMRKRLIQFLGASAHNIHIFTFHAFANQVIQENMYLFSQIKELQPLSELEKSEVFIELIDSLPNDHRLKRFKGNVYFEKNKLDNLFNDMKKEGWTVAFLHAMIDNYLEELKSHPDYTYKVNRGKYKKGDLRESVYNPEKEKMENLKSASTLFDSYQKILKEKGRYDYNDMILWVLDVFDKNQELLLRYQEQYHYFLVDEYQDTNGAQNKLLAKLVDFWENPNIFAVGDDDQSIFRFQGANMDNITDFQEKYQPDLIILAKNYRSGQIILDASASVIKYNQNRLTNYLNVDKHIVAGGENKSLDASIQVIAYPNYSQEEAGIFLEIEAMFKDKKDLSKVAIIYRNHKQVEDLVKVFESQNIPLNVRKKVNVLNEVLIKNIIQLLRFIHSEYKEPGQRTDLLYRTLISPIFNISYGDMIKIGQLTAYDPEKKVRKTWMEVMANPKLLKSIEVSELEKIQTVFNAMSSWLVTAPTMTVQQFIEKVITETSLLQKALLAADNEWQIQVLNTFFDFIKEEAVRNPKMDLGDLLESIDKMEISDVSLPIQKIITADNGVNFITAHSAKGLEFEKVFIIGANGSKWETKRAYGQNYKYPENLFLNSSENQEEDERRLFFVATTRAEKNLTITYANANDKGADQEASRYVTELMDGLPNLKLEEKSIENEQLLRYKALTMQHVELPAQEMINKALVDQQLENFKMSVTALNKYLKCPISFYYENIVRVPQSRNANAGFGNAVHYALDQFFTESKKLNKEGFASAKVLIEFFKKGMMIFRSNFTEKEFDLLSHFGEECFTAYHTDQLESWFKPEDYLTEFNLSNGHYKGVPIRGIIDKIDIYKDYVHVIDFKTSKPENMRDYIQSPKSPEETGGDYWRQIIYYKILLESDTRSQWNVVSGEVNLIIPQKKDNKIKQHKLVIQPENVEFVGNQLVEVYNKILKHEFTTGCGDEKCKWCNFVRDKKILNYAPNKSEDFDEERS